MCVIIYTKVLIDQLKICKNLSKCEWKCKVNQDKIYMNFHKGFVLWYFALKNDSIRVVTNNFILYLKWDFSLSR